MSGAQQLVGAVVLGAAAGGLLMLDARVIVAVGVMAAVAAVVMAVRPLLSLPSRRVAGVAWAATAFTAPFNGVRLSDWIALSDVFLLVAVAAMLPSIALGERSSLPPVGGGVLVGLAMIVVGGLVGTFFAARPSASLVEIVKFVVAAAGSVVAVRLWGPDAPTVRRFCALWLAGALVSALWALTFSTTVVGRPLGLATHPNHLAVTCLLGAAVALGFALGDRRRVRGLSVLALVPLVLALLASGSRAALLGFFFLVPAVAVLSYRVQLAAVATAVAAVSAVAVLLGVVHIPSDTGLGRLLGDASTPGSDVLRMRHLGGSIQRFVRHPLTGEGFEFAQEAHNIYVQVVVAAGPLGLIGLVVAAGSILGAARALLRASPARVTGDLALLAGLAGGYVGYLVAGLFQNILWDRYLWLFVAAILALAASLRGAPIGVLTPAAGTDSPSRPRDRPHDDS